MSAFLTPLKLDDDGDGIVMTLDADLIYQSDLLGKTITVSRGFATDFASIPKVLWNILPQHGPYDKAAIVHDLAYQTTLGGLTRAQADALLNEAMGVCGVSRLQRWIIFAGVRIGGAVAWSRYRRAEASAKSVVGDDSRTARV